MATNPYLLRHFLRYANCLKCKKHTLTCCANAEIISSARSSDEAFQLSIDVPHDNDSSDTSDTSY